MGANMYARAARRDASLYASMLDSHQYLDDRFSRLLDAMEAHAPEVRKLWIELDHGLHAHMEAEERFVLPAFACVHRTEALELLRDHSLIREQLLELGVAVDLHAIRFDRSLEFIETLQAHAGREENLLYRWADEWLDFEITGAALTHALR